MMSKTAVIRARVEPTVKRKAESVFRRLGVSTTQAIAIYYKQVILRQRLPFDVAIPNRTTRRTFEATDGGRDMVLCKNAEDMFRKLGI
jgi:DNA-damage-inducible protein J